MSLQLSQIGEAEPTADVLIVGSGPAGLFAACEFVRHGVKPRVVERRLAPHREARGPPCSRRRWTSSTGLA